MKISVITLFPGVFDPILNTSILKRAQNKGKISFELIDLRSFGEGKHKIVDGRPYGGSAGMILKPNILAKALKSITSKLPAKNYKLRTILTSASGKPYIHSKALELSKLDHLIIVCGHYEGVDQRFIEKYVSEEVSIGDYVLTGGEIPAMVIIDSVVRLIPKVIKKEEATADESFAKGLLEYPHYTRPEKFEDRSVPRILLSGNHGQIQKWREQKSLEKTKKVRPDLLK